jgi:hypothetical protein
MSYHIGINEYQRRLIMKALTSTDVNQFSRAPGSGDAFNTEAKEITSMRSSAPPEPLRCAAALS